MSQKCQKLSRKERAMPDAPLRGAAWASKCSRVVVPAGPMNTLFSPTLLSATYLRASEGGAEEGRWSVAGRGGGFGAREHARQCHHAHFKLH